MLKRFRTMEPAVAFFAIRALVYIAVGVTGSWLSPENVQPILAALGSLLGVDAVTTAGTRNSVTPTAKLEEGRGGR